MISVHYLYELHRYTLSDLSNIMKDDEKTIRCFWENSNNPAFKLELYKGVNYFYVNFVGVIVESSFVLHILPAYLKEKKNEKEQKKNYESVIKAIDLYYKRDVKKEITITPAISNKQGKISKKVEVLLELLRNYYKDGAYETKREVTVENGSGFINWEETIDVYTPLIVNSRPIYLQHRTVDDVVENNIIRDIHHFFVGKINDVFKESGLLRLLNYPVFEEQWYELERIGPLRKLQQVVKNEQRTQFDAKKIYILKTLLLLLEDENSTNTISNLSKGYTFGTYYFSHVWEAACKAAFNDKLNEPINDLPIKDKENWDKTILKEPLQSYLPNVSWEKTTNNVLGLQENKIYNASGPIPDVVSFYEADKQVYMIILDAKYYNIYWEDSNLKNSPGFNDVIKQYIYELSFQEFNNNSNIIFLGNAFLFPKSNPVNDQVQVSFSPMHNHGMNFNLIFSIELPAEEVFNSYLLNKESKLNNAIFNEFMKRFNRSKQKVKY